MNGLRNRLHSDAARKKAFALSKNWEKEKQRSTVSLVFWKASVSPQGPFLGSAKDERRSVWGTANQRHFVSFARFLCRLYPSIKIYTSTYTFFTRELIIQRVVWESRARLGDSAVWHLTRPLLVSCFFWKHTIEVVCCGNRLPCFLKQRFPAPGWLVWLFIVKFRQLIQNLFTLKKLSK